MTTPQGAVRYARTPSSAFTLTPRTWCAGAAAAALLALLAACGGGGDTVPTPTPTPTPTPQARTLVGPQQVSDLSDTCLNNPGREGDAPHACYEVDPYTGYHRVDHPLLQLRSDGSGGLLIKTLTDPAHSDTGQLARISPSGARQTLDVPAFSGSFDVAGDGTLWMVHTDESTGASEIRTLEPQGSTRVVARSTGSVTLPIDGRLAGRYDRIAAGSSSVYLWNTASPLTPPLQLRRNGAGVWQPSQSIPLPPGSNGILRFRSDAQDRLWLLVDDPYRTPLTPASTPALGNYQSVLELWRWSDSAGWQRLGSRNYTTDAYIKGNGRDVLVTDFSPRPDGSAVLSGGYTGSLYAIDAQGRWQVLMQRQGKPLRQLQQQGDASQIPVDGVFGTAALPDGRLAFIDPTANRVQRFDGTRLSVLSGESWPLLSAWQRLSNMRLLGFFADGRLLLTPRNGIANVDPGVIGFAPGSGTFELLEDPDSLSAFEWCNGLSSSLSCSRGRLAHPIGNTVALSQEASPRIFRVDGHRIQWQSSGASGTLPLSRNESIDVTALDANAQHLLRLGAPDANGRATVYRLPLSGGTWEVVAAPQGSDGALPVSAAYGRAVDLSTVQGAKHLAVRADGGLWLANDSVLWLISKTGELRLVAGRARPGAATPEAAVDSADGAAVRFGQIERIRALPDGRALVVDSAGHAVRTVTEQGQTAALVGTLNQSGTATAALPGQLNQPVDALVAAGVLYITEKNNPQMSRVSGALP